MPTAENGYSWHASEASPASHGSASDASPDSGSEVGSTGGSTGSAVTPGASTSDGVWVSGRTVTLLELAQSDRSATC